VRGCNGNAGVADILGCSTSAACACSARSRFRARSPRRPSGWATRRRPCPSIWRRSSASRASRFVERGANSIRFTPAGTALVEHARGILERLSAAEAEIRALGGLSGPQLRLAAFSTASATILAEAVHRFRRRHPEIELTLVEGDPEDTLPRLRTGQLDVVLTYEYDHVPLAEDPAIERVALLVDPIRLVVRAGHPVLERPAVRLHDSRRGGAGSDRGGGAGAPTEVAPPRRRPGLTVTTRVRAPSRSLTHPQNVWRSGRRSAGTAPRRMRGARHGPVRGHGAGGPVGW